MAVTTEYLVLQDSSPQLRIGFKTNIETLADDFRTKGLIDDKCHDIVTSTRTFLMDSEKANEILKKVMDSVRLSIKFYYSMINILKQSASPVHQDLAEKLEEMRQKKGGGVYPIPAQGTPAPQLSSPVWHEEIKSHLLNLIRYRDPYGNQKELRLLSEMAPNWEEIGQIVTLSPAVIRSVRNAGAGTTPEQCIRGVILKWLENAPNMERSDRFPNNWWGLHNLLTDSLSGTAAANLKKAIEASHSDFLRNLDSAPDQPQVSPVQQQFQPQAHAGGGVAHQQHQVPVHHEPAAPAPAPVPAQPSKSSGKRKKLNKNQLAEWLEGQGVDEDDVKLLKDRGVNEMLFLNLKGDADLLKDVSQATLLQFEMLKDELKNL